MPNVVVTTFAVAVLIATVIVTFVTLRWLAAPPPEPVVTPPDPTGPDRPRQVRLLGSDDDAESARTEALRAEIAGLEREIAHAQSRRLDNRADQLRAVIAERRRELRRRDPDAP